MFWKRWAADFISYWTVAAVNVTRYRDVQNCIRDNNSQFPLMLLDGLRNEVRLQLQGQYMFKARDVCHRGEGGVTVIKQVKNSCGVAKALINYIVVSK